jgi:hypothetical protein
LRRYDEAEQLSTLRVAEIAVNTAEQAEMEKKRTAAVAASAKVRFCSFSSRRVV